MSIMENGPLSSKQLITILMLLALFALVIFTIGPLMVALLWASILSILMYPIYLRFRKNFSETMSSLLSVMSTFFFIALPLILVGLMSYAQYDRLSGQIIGDNPDHTKKISLDLLAVKADEFIVPIAQQLGSDFKVATWVKENDEKVRQSVAVPLTKGAGLALQSIVIGIVSLLTMFFMLKDSHQLRKPFVAMMPINPKLTEHILDRGIVTTHAVLIGVLFVALIQGTIATTAYAFLGVDGWLLWGFATTILCAVPLLGAPVIYVPVAISLAAQGKTPQAIILLIVGFGIVSNVDNFLRPKYIGKKARMQYITIFFALLGGVFAFGPIGLFLGPLVLSTVLCVIEWNHDKLFPVDDTSAI